ncbi:M48 family metallopeptidase [Streptomyces lydicus]|uniref:M48 family metallopeptidase n=1 Tax=Streptomyces lydicus TaxID=47763 RepID=UPI0037A129FF
MSSPLEQAILDIGLPPEWHVAVEVRPRRSTLGIEVHPDGSVLIAVPEGVDTHEIVPILRGQADRIARAVAGRIAIGGVHPVKELVDGEHFSYLGRTYRLRLTEPAEQPVRLHGDWLELAVEPNGRPRGTALVAWYTAQGEAWIRDSVASFARGAGVPTPQTRVSDLGARWGVRERDGRIAVHWATFQLAQPLIELILAHELTHLRVGKHSSLFRQELRKLVPELSARERWLADVGSEVWLGATRQAA